MRLVSFNSGGSAPQTGATPRIGVRVGHRILDIEASSRVNGEPLPSSMKSLLAQGRGALSRVQALAKAAQSQAGRYSGAMFEERAIRYLPPVPDPDKFFCVGEDVTGSAKANGSLTGHEAKVARPAMVKRLDCGPELVFVIGKRALGVKKTDDPWDYVAGVTVMNDFTHDDIQGPVGPEIVTLDEIRDPYDLWMVCTVNGQERVRTNTRDHLWKMNDILEHFSRTGLEPGDCFSVRAPRGAGKLEADVQPGDTVECSIDGVMTLRNTIVAA